MMTTKRKFGKRSKNSPIRTRKINLTWHADFWEFYKNNQSDINFIIRANIQSRFQPTAAVSERDLENDILVKLHDSDFLQHFCPSKSSLNTYLTAKIRYHIKHVINRMSTRSRILGHQMMTSDINSYVPSATDGMFQLRDQESCTDRLAVENEIIARIAEDLPRKTQEVLKMKLDEHTLTEISKKMGCSVEFVRQLKEKIYEKARRVLGLEKALPCQRQKAPEQPLTTIHRGRRYGEL